MMLERGTWLVPTLTGATPPRSWRRTRSAPEIRAKFEGPGGRFDAMRLAAEAGIRWRWERLPVGPYATSTTHAHGGERVTPARRWSRRPRAPRSSWACRSLGTSLPARSRTWSWWTGIRSSREAEGPDRAGLEGRRPGSCELPGDARRLVALASASVSTTPAYVIVVGGGHNGLACAAYLAKAGRDVLVLERRDVLGRGRLRHRADVGRLPDLLGGVRGVVVAGADRRRAGSEGLRLPGLGPSPPITSSHSPTERRSPSGATCAATWRTSRD